MEQQELNFDNKTILVFGGCGFIGSNFVRHILANYPTARIVVFDKLTYSGNLKNLEDVYNQITVYAKVDIADKHDVNHVFEEEEPDFVINFAAETHVDRSIHVSSEEFIRTNIDGVYNVLEACKTYGIEKFVQVSTDEVYGQLPNPYDALADDAIRNDGLGTNMATIEAQKFTENSTFKPNVPYSASKAAGDCLCNAWHHTWDVPVVVTHCSNNYGPYQYPEKLVPFWTMRVLSGQKIPMYGDGLNVRDWIHVDDHVDALVLCLLNGVPGEVYNIGADNERTNKEMALNILTALDVKFDSIDDHLEYVKDRPGHDRRYAIDHSKISRELGWFPKYGPDKFIEKLRETIKWYQDHKEWVDEIITRTGVANPHIDLWKGVMSEEDLK